MKRQKHNTEALWRSLQILLTLLIVIGISGVGYISLHKPITEFLSRPKYTTEQLTQFTKARTKANRQDRANNWDLVENGIHVKTGLKDGEHLQVVIQSCLSCHSAKLITQNRATRQGWKDMIVWMQATQGLQNLGANEPKIIDYLAEHYAPKEVGRRPNLNIEEIEWYVLDLKED